MPNSLGRVRRKTVLPLAMALGLICCQPPSPTALDHVPELHSSAYFGVNMGYYHPYWTEEQQAGIARSFGCATLRTGLFHEVLEKWGYEHKAETLRRCIQMGFSEMVGILGYPAPNVRDTLAICRDGLPQTMFNGLYLPVWKSKKEGSSINEDNTYALYVWKAATHFKGLIHIYEVWNEPDAGWGGEMPGRKENWWDAPPPPCHTGLRASVFQYVRMLRITYEVIKKIDPDALIAVGGLGWPAYLDAVCRYTDQPENGLFDKKYPLPGGAYFDCMSFHAYPHLYAMEKQDATTGGSNWQRHSDAALDGLWQRKKAMEDVLLKYGFDGIKYPLKKWICSEFNFPRAVTQDRFGGETTQINFVLKALISAHWNGINQMHLYSFADEAQQPSIDAAFAYMGLVSAPDTCHPAEVRPHRVANFMQNLAKCLSEFTFDPSLTKQLQLPESVAGGSFRNQRGGAMIIIWLKTTEDRREDHIAKFTIPQDWKEKCWMKYSFETETWEQIHPSTHQITLQSIPVILKSGTYWQ